MKSLNYLVSESNYWKRNTSLWLGKKRPIFSEQNVSSWISQDWLGFVIVINNLQMSVLSLTEVYFLLMLCVQHGAAPNRLGIQATQYSVLFTCAAEVTSAGRESWRVFCGHALAHIVAPIKIVDRPQAGPTAKEPSSTAAVCLKGQCAQPWDTSSDYQQHLVSIRTTCEDCGKKCPTDVLWNTGGGSLKQTDYDLQQPPPLAGPFHRVSFCYTEPQ